MEQDEVIFGKNAVLAFLEQEDFSGEHPDLPQPETTAAPPRVTINKIMLAEGGKPDPRIQRIQALARTLRIPLQTCSRRRLDQLCGPEHRHQGVLALVSPAALWDLDQLMEKTEADRAARRGQGRSMDGYVVAVADGVEDPQNLGAIIRVAEASGVAALVIPQRRAAGVTGTVAKTSAGAIANLPLVRVSNLVQAIDRLKKSGFWVVGLDAAAPQLYTQADLQRPLVAVVGSEGRGIGRLVGQHCDFLVSIPMLGKTNSLNASVAAGIFFYEVVRQNLI